MATDALRELSGPAGSLEVLLDAPSGPARAAAVFAHPHPLYGGSMHTKVVYHAAKALARIGVAAMRFNFRGVGRSSGSFDGGVGEADDFRSVLNFVASRYPELPLWAGGFSFGSWIAMVSGAADPRVTLLLGIAPVVDQYDYSVVKTSVMPKFIIHGEEDEVVPVKAVRRFYGECSEPKELVVIDAADHLFDGKTTEVGEAVEDLLGDYI
jgi:alpha/beta superfamily hydrolase